MSFRKPCHMLFRKLIPPFIPAFYKKQPRNNTPGLSLDSMTAPEFSSLGKMRRNTPGKKKLQLSPWLRMCVMKNRRCQSRARCNEI